MNNTISPDELNRLVDDLLLRQERIFLALDGPCAAGKTTLAESLARKYGWSVVHMDDFFLRPEQRTLERYATPGGNVDYERVAAQVLAPLKAGSAATYRPLDCSTLSFAAPVTVAPCGVILVEGAYSCHPGLWDDYDLHLFLPVDPAVQMDRIRRRNGQKAEQFRTRWIPLEQAYFDAYSLPERCDYILRT